MNLIEKWLEFIRNFELPAGAVIELPDAAFNLDLPAGSYTVGFVVRAASVEAGPDEAWGLLLDAQGLLPLPIY